MHNYEQDQIYGTWFPTSFHGHFRSKSRNDFSVPYRQKAKPPPPTKFLNRSSARSTDHLFSRHDNRNVHAATMGDLEMHFSHGLGRRKPHAGAAQRYKNTSSLLQWSDEPRCSPISSYRADFMGQSLRQTRIANEMEPIHSRGNYALRRKQLKPATGSKSLGTAPLLAWNLPDESTYAKPCIGSERPRTAFSRTQSRESNTRLSRANFPTRSAPIESSKSEQDLSHVIETVTKLDL